MDFKSRTNFWNWSLMMNIWRWFLISRKKNIYSQIGEINSLMSGYWWWFKETNLYKLKRTYFFKPYNQPWETVDSHHQWWDMAQQLQTCSKLGSVPLLCNISVWVPLLHSSCRVASGIIHGTVPVWFTMVQNTFDQSNLLGGTKCAQKVCCLGRKLRRQLPAV